MRVQRLLRGGVAGLAVAAVLAGVGVAAVPAQAQECPPPAGGDVCQTELEDYTDFFVGLQVDVTGPSQPPEGAIAEFVTAMLGALNSREQAIVGELNGMRVGTATAALRTAIGSRNMLLHPDPGIRRDFVYRAAEAAYLAESFLVVSSGDLESADDLGQVGMVAYALYVTGTVATGESLPQPDADEELILVLEEYLRFLELLLDVLLGGGETSDAASEAKDALEDAVERLRNRDPGGGGGGGVIEYVALGDSYASGTGTGHYTAPGPPACYRSHLAYPSLLAGALTPSGQRLRPVNVACHGARFQDYMYPQMGVRGIEGAQGIHLKRETTGLVTVSMGGNDLVFGDIVYRCLWHHAGFCGVGEGNPLATPQQLDDLRKALTGMYINILSRIRPDGKLVVLTYPNITPPSFLNDDPCWITDKLISRAELAMIADLTIDLRLTIETAVAAVGSPRVQVVDMSDAFRDHWICQPVDPWANALRSPLNTSFHPNAAGHRQYARKIAQALGLTGFNL